MIPYVFTSADVQSHLADWSGFTSAASQDMQRKIKRSIDNAYRTLTQLRNWTFYVYRGRINTNALYNTGTIAYTNSTRTVTLTGGTFPSNASLCWFRVGPVDYRVVAATSTTLTLSINSNPNQDIISGTSYILYQDTYPLPVNFREMGTLRDCNRSRLLQFVPQNDMIASRQIYQTPTLPFRYTILTDPSYMGVSAIQLYPPPDQFYQYDYMGYRCPRPFTNPVPYSTGTVTTSGTTVTGTGTTWTSQMIGCVLRLSSSTTAPTGMYGSNPFLVQRIVTGFTSATQLTIDQNIGTDVSNVAYELSDPIDMDAALMYTAFLRLCEFELGQILNRDDINRLKSQYDQAFVLAAESDSRSFDSKPGSTRFGQRVSDYQALTDASS